MPYFEAIELGVIGVFSWPGILIPVAGTLLAMATSFLPGVGSTSLAAFLLVITMDWDRESVLLLFGAITGGATFMGSITAILFNIPGGVSSTPTLLDGYPMGRNGYARTAIACAATASAVGSVIGVILLLSVLPLVRPFLLEFGPLERLLVGIWGLMTIISVPTGSPLKASFMAAFGLVVAMFGVDPGSGLPRWNFGSLSLTGGFSLVPVLLGVFTFSELLSWMRTIHLEKAVPDAAAPDDSVRKGIHSVFRHPGLVLRSSMIGSLVGMIPGVGGTVAGFVAYGQSVQTAKGDKSQFGNGDIRGVIAPEAAVDAKDGGSLLPALAFGLPGSEAGVMLLAVFAVHGIVPGLPMLNNQLPLTFLLIMALLFSNILTSVLGIAATPWLARLKRLRIDRLALPCLIVSILAVLQLESRLLDVYTAIGFGLLGYFWRAHDWPRVPFVIAFVLGSLIETNLVLTVQLIELDRIVPQERIASVALFIMILGSVLWLRTRRMESERSVGALTSDAVIGMLASLAAAVLVLIALFGGAGYSWYAKFLITLSLVLGLVIAGWSLKALYRSDKTLFLNPLRWSVHLLPPPEQRLPLVLLVLLALLIGFTGISMAIGLVAIIWFYYRAPPTPGGRLRALASGILLGLVTYYFVNFVANLLLPQSLLERWLGI
jgi:putative tricarboxylic transport membrane protein